MDTAPVDDERAEGHAISRRLRLVAVISAGVLLAAGFFAAMAVNLEMQASGWVSHTHLVLEKINHTRLSVANAKVSLFGYLLTHDAVQERAYRAAVDDARGSAAQLTALTADNPRQQRRAGAVRDALEVRLVQFEQAAGLWIAGSVREAATGVDGEDRPEKQRLQQALLDMQTEEERLLAKRLARAQHASEWGMAATLGASGLALTLLTALFWLSYRFNLRQAFERDVLTASREETQRKEMLLRFAVKAARMETWAYDPSTRRFLFQGSRWGEMPIETVTEGIEPSERGEVVEQFLRTVATGVPFDREFRYRLGDEWRWLRSAGLPDGQGRIVGVVEDITARKRDVEQLRQADRQKDQFIATLAHELRNPLAPIRYATRLLEDVPEPKVAYAQGVIHRQVGMMATLLNQLLDLSHISSGTVAIERVPVEMARVVEDAVEDIRGVAQAAELDLSLALPPTPVTVTGDRVRLAQVMANLLQNAIKFTPRGGRIAVSLDTAGDKARIDVTDSGIGLAAEMLHPIFDPLVQVRAGPDTRGGLGIGLAVVRQLVEMHGGSVRASSAGPGLGATFEVLLPLSATLPTRAPAKTPAVIAPGFRILVADDQPDAARTLEMVLQSQGHEVRTAADGWQAKVVAASWRPDLMILDIGMPEATGDEVARWVRAQPWGAAVRLVAVSGWGRPQDRERLRDAGFDAMLVKPVAVETLLDALIPAANHSEAAGPT